MGTRVGKIKKKNWERGPGLPGADISHTNVDCRLGHASKDTTPVVVEYCSVLERVAIMALGFG